ncbi:hypothetical protein [Pseudonocardia nigra]|uniref:hypothetical protein n=1 Tax=Pseudonocardia nigra TaxID=1921578 RepID=UPI001C60535A|nr:hypothetical protein [Pseudonocardia nigra]
MTGINDPDEPSVVDIAVQFMAQQPGGAERVLALHRPLADGLCAACLTTVTRWPCSIASLALLARPHIGSTNAIATPVPADREGYRGPPARSRRNPRR